MRQLSVDNEVWKESTCYRCHCSWQSANVNIDRLSRVASNYDWCYIFPRDMSQTCHMIDQD